jgi:hypothetical protein
MFPNRSWARTLASGQMQARPAAAEIARRRNGVRAWRTPLALRSDACDDRFRGDAADPPLVKRPGSQPTPERRPAGSPAALVKPTSSVSPSAAPTLCTRTDTGAAASAAAVAPSSP